jgi:predicted RNase H-like HicB family nuclease
MSEPLRLTIVYEDAGDGWVLARIPEVRGAVSQGTTREEARENVIDALRLMLRPDPAEQDDATAGERELLELTIGP